MQVREILNKVLRPKTTDAKATGTHKALLKLSENRKGRRRLITTNFDRLFQMVMRRDKLRLPVFQAPLLPVPKTRWNGLVYLHGLLAAKPDVDNLNSLVLSSGDFGLAYLTERWAARFVSETVSQLHGVLRRLQHRRSGVALHDGRPRRGPPTG